MSEVMQGARDRARATWSAGDWDAMADTVSAVGPRLLEAIGGVGPGVRLLDVGTGSGSNVAIPAAVLGAEVVGADITDAWFGAAQARAANAGVAPEWVVGPASAMPVDDASFDVVASTFGHMFDPDHAATARELVRVCKPGGTIGYAAWTPTGKVASVFMLLARRLPPPPDGVLPPPLWGDEAHARELLEPLGAEISATVRTVALRYDSVDAQLELMTSSFGPMVAARAALGDDVWIEVEPELRAQMAADNEATDGTSVISGEYLEVIARTAAA